MKKFFIILLILTFTFIIVDRVGGHYMSRLAQNPNNTRLAKLNYIVNEMDEEILLFGTSRILHALDPEIIKDSTDFKVFNCGISGGKNIYTHYMLLNYILQHHKPQLIVLEINYDDFLKSEKNYSINKFSHFYGRDEECDSFLINIDGEKGLLISRLYKYNLILKDLIVGKFIYKKKWRRDGYEPLKKTRKDLTNIRLSKKETYQETSVDYNHLKILKMFFEKCRKNGINVILVSLPEYKLIDDHFYDPVKKLAQKFQLPFYDYHKDLGFEKNYKYFSDKLHLKTEGATELSYIFSHDLKNYLSCLKGTKK